jgi:transposase
MIWTCTPKVGLEGNVKFDLFKAGRNAYLEENKMAKRYSPKLKFQVVLELLQGTKTPGQVAKAYRVHPNTVINWKQTLLDKGPEIFNQNGSVAEYEQQIADLEQLLGKKEVEIALLKNFLGRSR